MMLTLPSKTTFALQKTIFATMKNKLADAENRVRELDNNNERVRTLQKENEFLRLKQTRMLNLANRCVLSTKFNSTPRLATKAQLTNLAKWRIQ